MKESKRVLQIKEIRCYPVDALIPDYLDAITEDGEIVQIGVRGSEDVRLYTGEIPIANYMYNLPWYQRNIERYNSTGFLPHKWDYYTLQEKFEEITNQILSGTKTIVIDA